MRAGLLRTTRVSVPFTSPSGLCFCLRWPTSLLNKWEPEGSSVFHFLHAIQIEERRKPMSVHSASPSSSSPSQSSRRTPNHPSLPPSQNSPSPISSSPSPISSSSSQSSAPSSSSSPSSTFPIPDSKVRSVILESLLPDYLGGLDLGSFQAELADRLGLHLHQLKAATYGNGRLVDYIGRLCDLQSEVRISRDPPGAIILGKELLLNEIIDVIREIFEEDLSRTSSTSSSVSSSPSASGDEGGGRSNNRETDTSTSGASARSASSSSSASVDRHGGTSMARGSSGGISNSGSGQHGNLTSAANGIHMNTSRANLQDNNNTAGSSTSSGSNQAHASSSPASSSNRDHSHGSSSRQQDVQQQQSSGRSPQVAQPNKLIDQGARPSGIGAGVSTHGTGTAATGTGGAVRYRLRHPQGLTTAALAKEFEAITNNTLDRIGKAAGFDGANALLRELVARRVLVELRIEEAARYFIFSRNVSASSSSSTSSSSSSSPASSAASAAAIANPPISSAVTTGSPSVSKSLVHASSATSTTINITSSTSAPSASGSSGSHPTHSATSATTPNAKANPTPAEARAERHASTAPLASSVPVPSSSAPPSSAASASASASSPSSSTSQQQQLQPTEPKFVDELTSALMAYLPGVLLPDLHQSLRPYLDEQTFVDLLLRYPDVCRIVDSNRGDKVILAPELLRGPIKDIISEAIQQQPYGVTVFKLGQVFHRRGFNIHITAKNCGFHATLDMLLYYHDIIAVVRRSNSMESLIYPRSRSPSSPTNNGSGHTSPNGSNSSPSASGTDRTADRGTTSSSSSSSSSASSVSSSDSSTSRAPLSPPRSTGSVVVASSGGRNAAGAEKPNGRQQQPKPTEHASSSSAIADGPRGIAKADREGRSARGQSSAQTTPALSGPTALDADLTGTEDKVKRTENQRLAGKDSKHRGEAITGPAARPVDPGIYSNYCSLHLHIDDLSALWHLLPERFALRNHERVCDLLEIVLDVGRYPEALFSGDIEEAISSDLITREDLQAIVKRIGSFDGENRAAIPGTVHRISCIRNKQGDIVGLTFRIGRIVSGLMQMIDDVVARAVTGNKSILFLGGPGKGKTSVLRELARVLSVEARRRVMIIDTANEIAGDGDVPHPAIGRARRMQASRASEQHLLMLEAIHNHMSQVIVVDAIGKKAEADACRAIVKRGAMVISAVPAHSLADLMADPVIADLITGSRTIPTTDQDKMTSDATRSTVTPSATTAPVFEVVVELQERDRWIVHEDARRSAEAIVGRKPFAVTVRRFKHERAATMITTNVETVNAHVGSSSEERVSTSGQ